MSEITVERIINKIQIETNNNVVEVLQEVHNIEVSKTGEQGRTGETGPTGPQGPQGDQGINTWGSITGTLSDQTDLQDAQDTQDAAIALNTTKISYTDAAQVATNTGNISTIQGEQITQDAAIALNTAKNSYPSADAAKLAGIEAGAQVNTIDSGDNVSLLVNDVGYQVAGGAGMLSDTAVTIATATSVDISAGDGFISTNNADGTVTNTSVSWNASTESIPAAILAVDQAFYITKDSAGTTQFYAFPIDETVISVEIAIVSAGVISGSILTIGSGNFGAKNQMTEQTLAELFLNLGPALEGVEIVPDAADLTFDVTSGAEFFGGNNWRTDRQNPNHFQFAGLTNPTFIYAYQDPAEANGWTSFATTTIDPDQWDDGTGTLASVPNGSKVTIQPLWVSVTTGTVIAQLGQQTYKDVATALSALPTAAEMATPAVANLPRLGWLVTTKGQTILADATYIKQLNKGTNISPSAAVKMQDAYNNTDTEPEILTDSTRGAVSFQRGSAADTDNVFEVQNGAGSTTFSVDGNGNVTANNLQNLTDTDDLPEGVTNLYYTEARVSANTDVAANTAKVGVTNEPASDPSGVTGADAIINIMSLTQAEYDAIGTPNASTFYIITDA